MQETMQSFIRVTLGCNCPPEVFQRIRIDSASPLFEGLPHEAVADIGGRLLVLVVRVDDTVALQDSLPDYFRKGRHCRDDRGFNRFRLVVACNNAEAARTNLLNKIQSFDLDDRLHLHVLSQTEVPRFDTQSA